MSRFTQQRLTIVYGLICAAFFLIVLFSGRSTYDTTEQKRLYRGKEYNEGDFLDLIKNTYGESRVLDQICFNFLSCMEIRDDFVHFDGKRRIRRSAGNEVKLLTYGFLKLPEKLVKGMVDTSKWQMDFTTKPKSTAGAMIDEMFASGALSITRNSNARVLTLGLGGGFLSSYLHNNFPQMSITSVEIYEPILKMAEKWFSLKTDQNYHVKLGDGVRYLEDAVRRGLQFDVVILDACFIEAEEDVVCPSKVFLNDEPITNIAKLIGDRGLLTVNILPDSKYPKAVVDRINRAFLRHFKHSKTRHLDGTSNYIATFSQFEHKGLYSELYKISEITGQ